MDIVSRLKTFIDYLGIPVTQFADNCGIPRPTLSQLLNGRNKTVRDELIAKIHAAYPQLSVMWLMFGEGDILTADKANSSNIVNNKHDAPISSGHVGQNINTGASHAAPSGSTSAVFTDLPASSPNAIDNEKTMTSGAVGEKQNISMGQSTVNSHTSSSPQSVSASVKPREHISFEEVMGIDDSSIFEEVDSVYGNNSEKETATLTQPIDFSLDIMPNAGQTVVGNEVRNMQENVSAEQETNAASSSTYTNQLNENAEQITLNCGAASGRRVVSIIVYYDDKSYQTFVPQSDSSPMGTLGA